MHISTKNSEFTTKKPKTANLALFCLHIWSRNTALSSTATQKLN